MRVARAVLLVAVALGVYGMHTLGHHSGHHGGHQAGGHHAHEPGFAQGQELPDLDPAAVCLAVLTSFLIVATAAAWIVRRRGSATPGRAPSARRVARPPPDPVSVRLARLSVLRI
ncbi:hypothetical protein ACBI99_21490 [Nonomuraea sp. ATR24]|uniref:hypothetical protein n=1 Tax=Nonomuraea sp. ATR24 TaxID=1676744 RepID=UPI0035BECBA8